MANSVGSEKETLRVWRPGPTGTRSSRSRRSSRACATRGRGARLRGTRRTCRRSPSTGARRPDASFSWSALTRRMNRSLSFTAPLEQPSLIRRNTDEIGGACVCVCFGPQDPGARSKTASTRAKRAGERERSESTARGSRRAALFVLVFPKSRQPRASSSREPQDAVFASKWRLCRSAQQTVRGREQRTRRGVRAAASAVLRLAARGNTDRVHAQRRRAARRSVARKKHHIAHCGRVGLLRN